MSDKKTTKATFAAKNSRETRDDKKTAKATAAGNTGKLVRPRSGGHDTL